MRGRPSPIFNSRDWKTQDDSDKRQTHSMVKKSVRISFSGELDESVKIIIFNNKHDVKRTYFKRWRKLTALFI